VHSNGLVHAPSGLIARLAGSNAAGKIRGVRRVIPFGLFYDNKEAVHALPSLRPTKPGLLESAIQGPRSQVIAGASGNGDSPGLGPMLELAVTALCCREVPAIFLNEPDDVSDLHPERLARSASDILTCSHRGRLRHRLPAA
jgi:hypothetical protein